MRIFSKLYGIDVSAIGNVVAAINLVRGEAGSDPDGVDAQFMQLTHFQADAVEVDDTVVVGVRKAARIDFVNHGVLPSLMAVRCGTLSVYRTARLWRNPARRSLARFQSTGEPALCFHRLCDVSVASGAESPRRRDTGGRAVLPRLIGQY